MAMKLGTMLLREGVISPQQLEEALRLQVLYGGRLGTNLLEAGTIQPDELAHRLSQATGFPAATEAMLEAAPSDVVQQLPADMAERYECLPFQRDGRRLLVAMVKPSDIAAADAISFKTGARVIAHIAPELVLYAQLEKRYGIVRKLRYMRISRAAPAVPPPGQPVPKGRDAVPAVPPPQPAPNGAYVPAPAFSWDPGTVPTGVALPRHGFAPPVVRPTPPPEDPPPEEADAGLSIGEVVDELRTVPTREGIADTVLKFATDRIETMLLFVVRDGLALGWKGRGPGEANQTARLLFPLNVPSLFQQAVETSRPAGGPIVDTDVHRHLFRALQREAPPSGLVVPVLVRERAVNLIYIDCLGAIDAMAFVDELEEIAREIPAAYVRQLRANRQTAGA